MAARVLLRGRAAAPLMAATLAGAALCPAVAFAEAPPPLEDQPTAVQRKPIYEDLAAPRPGAASPAPSPPTAIPDSPTAEHKPRGPTPTDRLATQIGRARLFVYQGAAKTEDAVNSAMDSAFHLEKSFTETVAGLAPPPESGEKLMPGLVYALVASMAGSIVTRNRNILLRASVPVALGLGAGWVVLPLTMANVSGLLWEYERRVPALADAHAKTRDGIERGWDFAKAHSDGSKRFVEEKVAEARDAVEDWIKKGK